jgi:hypothetical protein
MVVNRFVVLVVLHVVSPVHRPEVVWVVVAFPMVVVMRLG